MKYLCNDWKYVDQNNMPLGRPLLFYVQISEAHKEYFLVIGCVTKVRDNFNFEYNGLPNNLESCYAIAKCWMELPKKPFQDEIIEENYV